MQRVRRLAVVCGSVYLGLVAVIALLQRQLLFFPAREPQWAMLETASRLGFEPWRDERGQIIGWARNPAPGVEAENKLIVFHGNAGHALHRENYSRAFESLDRGARWSVWLFEYPGYGARDGSPGRESFANAGRAAVAQLRALDSRPLFLLGESIGTGVACDLAANPSNGIAGVVLVTPFARLSDVAQMHYPFLPLRWLLRDRWDNVAALRSFRGPTAMIIAGQDEVLSAAQGESLFASAAEPKRRWFLPHATHNDLEIHGASWAAEVSAFLLDPGHAKH